MPLFSPVSEWKAPSLSDLPDWSNCKLLGFDTEFSDPTLRTLGIGARRAARLAGYSFCLDGDPGGARYIPLRHPEGSVDVVQGLAYLRDNIKKFRGVMIGANMNVDLDVIHYEDIRPDFTLIECQDICVRGPLIWELHHKYSLEAEAGRYGLVGKDEAELKHFAQSYGYDITTAAWKACIAHLPARGVGPYAENDAAILIPTYKAQQEVIDKQGLNDIVKLEAQVLPLLLKMRQRGVRIDFDHLDKVEKWSLDEEVRLVAEIKRLTGHDVGVGSCMAAARVAPALLAIGLTPDKTENGQWSITSEYLSNIEHPVGKLIRETRQVNKLRTTFVASVRSHQTNGRIHTTYRQIVGASEKNEKSGAAFGRLSSAHLNIQQQPSRGDFANFWRQIYIPEQNTEWLSCDYSSCEPRWTAHFSQLLNLPGAMALGDMYRSNPRLDPHQAMADLTGLKRKDAKQVGLGLTYGMGGTKLARQALKLPTRWLVQVGREKHFFETRKEALEFRSKCQGKIMVAEVAGVEAQEILDRFHNGAPFIRELARKVAEKVEATGFLRLLGGRIIHFPLARDGSYDWSFKAGNRLIQGTAGMQLKLALLAIDRDCPEFFMTTTVHDEVCGSITDRRTAKRVVECMVSATKCLVPHRCDAEIGSSWGSLDLVCLEKECLQFVGTSDKFACDTHAL
jgi:DNA polymerase I-like protein with 3'-5' exonuclease and polymerase domains